jgi:pimeloyl-ACP methyl ester carboxylesterase
VKRTEETFRARDGTLLHFTRVSRGRPDALLVVPGIFMNRSQAEHRLLAERMSEIADVVTLDVRGHGDSEGAFTFGNVEPEDVADLARHLRGQYRNVGGIGFSFGGYHTCIAAAEHRVYDAVALVGTPHRLFILDHNFLTGGLVRSVPWMAKRVRRFTRLKPTLPGPRSPSGLVDRIAPVPLLVVHGEDDFLIPPKHARELYDRAGEPKSLLMLPRGLHAENILAADPEPLLEGLGAFFRDRLLR